MGVVLISKYRQLAHQDGDAFFPPTSCNIGQASNSVLIIAIEDGTSKQHKQPKSNLPIFF